MDDSGGSSRSLAALTTSFASNDSRTLDDDRTIRCRRCQNSGERCHSKIFPCSIAMCCPCLPSSWKNVKDWLHLVLILGVLCSVVCVVLQVVEIATFPTCHSPFCFSQVVSILVVLPSLYDFFKFIGAYDESLQEHKQRAEDEVQGLIMNINQQVAEMQAVAAKLTESATDFAFRTFDGQREGFEKFILDLNLYYGELYKDPQLLEELRRFMLQWLTVFSQSLLDATTNPLLKGAEDEFYAARTLGELCDKVTGRLSRLKVSTRMQLVPAESYVLPTPRHTGSNLALEDGGDAEAEPARGKLGVSWLRLGCTGAFGRQVERTFDRDYVREYPVTVAFLCGSITILSRRHLNHLIYLLLDLGLIVYEGVIQQDYTMALVIANAICVLSTLACFEQIDEIAHLQRRIQGYRQRSERVKEQHQKANENWAKVQQLHDLWNYRTQPFLIIMGKIHKALDNNDREVARALEVAKRRGTAPETTCEQRLEWLQLANVSLLCLDKKLGNVADWTKEGRAPLDKEWKETIGRQLRDAEREENVEELIQKLPILTSDLRKLSDGSIHTANSSRPPSRSPSPSPPGSFASTSSSRR
eukprot:TRINITY_DN50333_c0_g1_i1.p1 TRINITY_DN50333_c0_g1~~TRINITY_DN50333_c0_g1_i1.p1  ORF type:complete len:586 (+),score=98.73 TRINITY_DN50333_c0_g1_i1:92-1849(+)